MKTIITLITIMSAYSSLILGQGYAYGYDDAGNRIIRYSVLSQVEDDTEIEETAEIADRNTQEDTDELVFTEEISLKLFPNPVNEFFTVQVTGDSFNELITLEIVNSSGQVVKEEQVSGMNNQVDTSNLASGFYVLKATFRNETLNWSFIKQL